MEDGLLFIFLSKKNFSELTCRESSDNHLPLTYATRTDFNFLKKEKFVMRVRFEVQAVLTHCTLQASL